MSFLELNKQLDRESTFLLFEPDERMTTVEQQRNMVSHFIHSENSTIILAVVDDQLVGHITVVGGNTNRIKHRAHIVVGILEKFSGQGIGRKLFEHVEHWRKTTCVTRLELTVMANNERAIALYEKVGFRVEGIKEQSIKKNNEYIDEYYMAKVYK